MRVLLLLACLCWSLPVQAQTNVVRGSGLLAGPASPLPSGLPQAPSGFPFTQPPTTHPEVFRQLAKDIFREVGQVLMGPNFGRGRAFSLTRTFRLSPAEKAGVDGLEKRVEEKIVVDSQADAATFNKDARARLPALVTKLAAKVSPYTVIGTLPNTSGKMTDPVSQTPDSLVLVFTRGGLVLRTRYTRGRFTGDHTIYADVLVGREVTP